MRKKINKENQAKVLTESRRRCALCFGLDRNYSIVQGQIAHLDQNNENNSYDNLVFLCLKHHDSYDSRTSQSKGLLKEEIIKYRDDLKDILLKAWNNSVDNLLKKGIDNVGREIGGRYERTGFNESANAEIVYLGDRSFRITAFSFWGTQSEFGPNIGQIESICHLIDNKSFYVEYFNGKLYRLDFEFNGDEIIVEETFIVGIHGANVNFGGIYKRKK